jgi:beta-lactamase class A
MRGRLTNRAWLRAAGAVAVVLGAPASLAAQSPRPSAPVIARADTAKLRRSLDSLAAAHRGVVGYSILNLDTGERLTLRGDETFPTASLIKVAVLVALYDLAEKKELSLDDPVIMLKIDRVPGSGYLQYLHPGLQLTLEDAAKLMTITSDNTATNLVLGEVEMRRVWQKMEALGLPHTKIHAKVFMGKLTSVAPDSTTKYGLGVTTPNEMAKLFELLARGKAVSLAADSSMLAILEQNDDNSLLQRYASGRVRAAHKTGAVDEARTECTLWYLASRVVACVFTKENKDTRWVSDHEGEVLMGRMGELIVKAWPMSDKKASP